MFNLQQTMKHCQRLGMMLLFAFSIMACGGRGGNDAPIVNSDNYTTVGNTLLEVGVTPGEDIAVKLTGSVLDNDTDNDGPDALSISSVGTPTLGGTVTMNANGSFSYTPPAGISALTDSFTYHVSDGDKTATGTVNINIIERVWYVDNRSSGGTGTSDDAFGTLVDAQSVLQSGDTLYVASGDGSTTGLDTGLEISVPNISLIGEGVVLEVAGITLAPVGVRPVIGNLTGDGLTLSGASFTLITGLDIADTLGDGLVVVNSSSVFLTALSISRSGESAIQGGGENVGLVLSDVVIEDVDVTDPSTSDDAIFIDATVNSSLVMSGGSVSGVPGSLGDGIEFENITAAPVSMNIDIRGVGFSDIAQDGIKLDNDHGVMAVQIGGAGLSEFNSFDVGFRGIQIQTGDDPTLNRTNTIMIQNNIITSADEGIQLRSITDNVELSILDNVLDRAVGGSSKDLIDLQAEFNANAQARVNRNVINNLSGAAGSDGIKVRVFDGASLSMEALGNTIDGPLEGFDFDVIDGTSTTTSLNATVLNNTLSNIVNVALNARNANGTSSTCLDLVGNSAEKNYELDALVGNLALTIGSQATVFNPGGGFIDSSPLSCPLPVF